MSVALSAHRPLKTTLVVLRVLLFGIAGYQGLALIELGNTSFSIIMVSAILPGDKSLESVINQTGSSPGDSVQL